MYWLQLFMWRPIQSSCYLYKQCCVILVSRGENNYVQEKSWQLRSISHWCFLEKKVTKFISNSPHLHKRNLSNLWGFLFPCNYVKISPSYRKMGNLCSLFFNFLYKWVQKFTIALQHKHMDIYHIALSNRCICLLS